MDLDGTLIASQPLWDASFTRLCEAARGRVTRRILGLLAGQSIAGTLELIAATGAAPAASSPRARAILDAMNDEVIALVAADPPLVPGARELVAAVAARGAARAGGLRTFQIGSVPLLPDDDGVTLVPSLTELDADRLLGPAERRY